MYRTRHLNKSFPGCPRRSDEIRKSSFLHLLAVLWVYGAWIWIYHGDNLSTTRRAASFLTGCSALIISLICWAYHPTPKFGYVEFLVFIFWPCHLGFIVGLLTPLRFIRREDSAIHISIIPQKRVRRNPTSIFTNYHNRGTSLCSTRVRMGLKDQRTNRTRTAGYLGAFSFFLTVWFNICDVFLNIINWKLVSRSLDIT